MTLPQILDRLERQHGKPKLRGPRDAYEMLLHRNCGYPQSDERCDKGFGALKEKIGLLPKNILGVPDRRLAEALRGSVMIPAVAARRIKEIAARVETKLAGNLRGALRGSAKEARKVLKQFPTIGDSAADKILLFSRIAPVAAIPANSVRVPLRLAFGEEKKSYAASYRAAQEYVEGEIPASLPARQRAYLLLKRHGEEICKNSKPLCEQCAVSAECAYFQRRRREFESREAS